MKSTRLVGALLSLVALSCANDGGPVGVDASWNLICPSSGTVDCGAWAPDTCLGERGERSVVGGHGQIACSGEPIIAACEAVERDGLTVVRLEAKVGDFAFELRGATVDGSDDQTACVITIVEDGDPYGGTLAGGTLLGACGPDTPSAAQPCQLSSILAENGEVIFDLECLALRSNASGDLAFDVGGIGGGPATISFFNCDGV